MGHPLTPAYRLNLAMGQAAVWVARSTVTVSGGAAAPVLLTGLKVRVSCFGLAVTRRKPESFWSCLLRVRPVFGKTVLESRYFTFRLSPGSEADFPRCAVVSGVTL